MAAAHFQVVAPARDQIGDRSKEEYGTKIWRVGQGDPSGRAGHAWALDSVLAILEAARLLKKTGQSACSKISA